MAEREDRVGIHAGDSELIHPSALRHPVSTPPRHALTPARSASTRRSNREDSTTSEADWAEIEENARTVTRAGWWIDQRSSEPEDLAELLMAATGADRPTENPLF
ncbi:hypothetical protein GTY72_13980 [Streptomyces sp. SID8378]|nr:hypothetical protein [Streptomyces sp. SID8378]